MYAAWLHAVIPWFPQYTLSESWKKANILVEGSDVEWAYLRCTGKDARTPPTPTTRRLDPGRAARPDDNRSFWTAHGSC